MFGVSFRTVVGDSIPAKMSSVLLWAGRVRVAHGVVPRGEVEIWLREGPEWRVFALHLEELVGFLLAENVNHKTRGGWDQHPRLAGSRVGRHALPGGSPCQDKERGRNFKLGHFE